MLVDWVKCNYLYVKTAVDWYSKAKAADEMKKNASRMKADYNKKNEETAAMQVIKSSNRLSER